MIQDSSSTATITSLSFVHAYTSSSSRTNVDAENGLRSSRGSTSRTSATGSSGVGVSGRGVRSVASESWDDDFLWQHSSSSDLHLPSSSTSRPAKRGSYAASSNAYRRSGGGGAKGSNVSSTFSQISAGNDLDLSLDDEDPTITLNNATGKASTGIPLHRSATSPVKTHERLHSQRSPSHRRSYNDPHRHSQPIAIAGAPRPSTLTSSSYSSASSYMNSAASSLLSTGTRRLVPESSSYPDTLAIPSPSMSSWRSPTPSLTSDLGHLSCTTETDNETEQEDSQIQLSGRELDGSNTDTDAELSASRMSVSSSKNSKGSGGTSRLALGNLFGRGKQKGKEIFMSGSSVAKRKGMAAPDIPSRGTARKGNAGGGEMNTSFRFGSRPSLRNTSSTSSGSFDTSRSSGGAASISLQSSSNSTTSKRHSDLAEAEYSHSPNSVNAAFSSTPTILTLKEQIHNNRTIQGRQSSSNSSTGNAFSTSVTPIASHRNSREVNRNAQMLKESHGQQEPVDVHQELDDVFSGIDDFSDEEDRHRAEEGEEDDTDQDSYSPRDLLNLRATGLQGILQRPGESKNASMVSLLSNASSTTTSPSVSFSSEIARSEPNSPARNMKASCNSNSNRIPEPLPAQRKKYVKKGANHTVESRNSASHVPNLSPTLSFPAQTAINTSSSPGQPSIPSSPTSASTAASTVISSSTTKRKNRNYRFGEVSRSASSRRDSMAIKEAEGGDIEESSVDEAGPLQYGSVSGGAAPPASPPYGWSRDSRGSRTDRKGKERMAFANDSGSEVDLSTMIAEAAIASTPSEQSKRTGTASISTGWFFSKNSGMKRFSKEVKTSKIPFPSPEKRKSSIFRTISRDTGATIPPRENSEDLNSKDMVVSEGEDEPRDTKSRRPLSLTAMLSRTSLNPSLSGTYNSSKSTPNGQGAELSDSQNSPRGRSGTLTSISHRPSALSLGGSSKRSAGLTGTRSAVTSPSASTTSFGLSVHGGKETAGLDAGRKTFIHRSTASSGNIPTAKSLLGGAKSQLDRRQSIDLKAASSEKAAPAKPPSFLQRRSFNPLFRLSPSNPPAIHARPTSSLSLLSEASTVRPQLDERLPTLSTSSTHDIEGTIRAASSSKVNNSGHGIGKETGSPTLRRRHLPSLSLSLIPGITSSTPPRSAIGTPPIPLPSPSSVNRPYTTIRHSPSHQLSATGSGYFNTTTADSRQTSSSPGGLSVKSSDSGNGLAGPGLTRRVSLSDLRIPSRISNAQAKIGQDLKRVKEFKEGVEELKRLRDVYRSLVTAEDTTDARTEGTANEMSDDMPTFGIPIETSSKVDHIFARVAQDYQEWWEIADVLINLADGAEVETLAIQQLSRNATISVDGQVDASTPSKRERCWSEMPIRMSPIKSVLPLDAEPVPPLPGVLTADTSPKSPPTANRDCPNKVEEGISPPLTRSFSASSFSAPTSFNSDKEAAGISASEQRSSLTASERQLEILRSMLRPQTTSGTVPEYTSPDGSVLHSTPTKSCHTVAPDSMPSRDRENRTPSPLARRATARTPAKPSLTPERRLPASLSVPARLSATPPSNDQPVRGHPQLFTSTQQPEVPKPKTRLRQVSRAGLLGIRDFLRALRKSGVNITLVDGKTSSDASMTSDSFTQTSPRLASPAHARLSRPSPARRVMSDTYAMGISSQNGLYNRTPVKNSVLRPDGCDYSSKGDVSGIKYSLGGSVSDDEEEEDWDEDLSDGSEGLAPLEGADLSPGEGGSRIIRSDTQATILASSAGTLKRKAIPRLGPNGTLEAKNRPKPSRGQRSIGTSTSAMTMASLDYQGNWNTWGAKLVMTTEAMPTLLAKINEVKQHCATCVTELRNVTV